LVVASGTEILTGANTYTGGTTITAGAQLRLGNGGTTGSIMGDVVDNGYLTFNRTDAYTFGSNISGSGNLAQVGSGTTILNGNNTVTGQTTISGGTLEIGDAAHPNAVLDSHLGGVSVGAGGTLAGHGTILGAVSNTSGGTVAPGGTIGTLTVGSYAQGSTSTLAIEVSPTMGSELVSVGAVSLGGKLAITYDPGSYAPHVWQILAGSAVTGTFSSVSFGGNVPGLAGGLAYTSTGVDLVLTPGDSAQAYGGISSATLDRAHDFAALVEDRFGDAGCADGSSDRKPDACRGMGAWATAVATTDHLNSDGIGYGYSNSGAGFVGGLDKRWAGGTSVGLAFGYVQNSFSMGSAQASASGASYYTALYGRRASGKTWFDGQAFYMHSDWSLSREVSGVGTAKSSPNADTEGLLVQASTAFLDHDSIRPYLRAAYAETSRSASTETGVGNVGFAINSATNNSGYAEVGLLLTRNFTGTEREARPSFQIGYQETIGDRSHNVQGSLVGVSGVGADFAVDSIRAPAGAMVLDGSLKVELDRRFEVWGGVRGRFGNGLTEGSASFGGVFRF
jgi:autotransporter-associated beta strand protein